MGRAPPEPGESQASVPNEQQSREPQQEGKVAQAVTARGAKIAASRRQQAPPALPLVLAGAAAVGIVAAVLLRRLQKRRGSVQRAVVRPEQVYSTLVHLTQPVLSRPTSSALVGRSLVVSDRVDIQSVETRFGSNAWKAERQPSQLSCPLVDVLVSQGLQCKAVVLSEPLGLGPLLMASTSGLPNPAGCGFHHGGGEFGAAVSVAAGLADLALAVDELGGARVPAACCGVYAMRPTAGVLPLEGTSTASHSLAAPALLAADPGVLLRAGQALRLPAGSAGDVAHYLVAEDFFAACGPEMQTALPAVVAAVKRWAGPDQAQGLSLSDWVYHRVTSVRAFLPPPAAGQPGSEAGNGRTGQQPRAVLAALAAAAEAVRRWEFCQLHGDWVAAQPSGSLEPEVLSYWQQAQQTSEERYDSARMVVAELSAAMRGALQEGYVFVLPTTTGPAPRADDKEAVSAFRESAAQLAALAALSGAPQVALPLPQAGSLPLSVSLVALHKRDLQLLQAAAKLGPMLEQEAARLEGLRAAERQGSGRVQQQQQTGGAATAGSRRSGGHSAGGRNKEQSEEDAMRAEAYKAEGNTAFKAERYQEAIRQYTLAIHLDPRSAVYFGNRALAYLKLGDYSSAEGDCDRALGLELSVKALLRRGSARLAQGNVEGAKADFKQALALEPQNRQAREELRGIQALEGPPAY